MKKATGSITAVLTALALLSGCSGSAPSGQASTSLVPATSPTSAASPQLTADKTVAAPTAPPATNPAPATGGITVNPAGAVLPNRARTPGAVNPSVTQANIGQTICVSGWTATVRPPSSFTTGLKETQLATGYTYKGDTASKDYEEDHLISLEIGGAPRAEANLWPEPYNSPDGARVKDVIENKLHVLVCDHAITLATAQKAIASNWWVAYQTYVGKAPAGGNSQAPAALAQPAPAPAPAPAPVPARPGSGATALCKDGTFSFAAHHQGACSGHGGVSVFYT